MSIHPPTHPSFLPTTSFERITGFMFINISPIQYFRNMEYRVYKDITSVLIPLPPRCFGRFPSWLKCCMCCEFPLYNHLDIDSEQQSITKRTDDPATSGTTSNIPRYTEPGTVPPAAQEQVVDTQPQANPASTFASD